MEISSHLRFCCSLMVVFQLEASGASAFCCMADIFRGRIIDVTEKSYTIELTGDQSKNDAFLEAIDRSAILETVRTGSSGIGRGERILRV